MGNSPADIIESWIGAKQGDTIHRYIIDSYNKIVPIPNGWKMNYKAAYCATTTSAAYHLAGLDKYFPSSASCSDQINKAKKMGIWVEDDKYIPKRNDCIMYDWSDSKDYAVTDNQNAPDHTGIVLGVENGIISVCEGNMGSTHKVGIRKLKVNGRYIRGFIVPNVKIEGNKRPVLKLGSKGEDVKYLHVKLKALGYGVNIYNQVFDETTKNCVMHFQKVNKLEVDGIVGKMTWRALDE